MNKNILKAGVFLVLALFGLFYTKNNALAVINSVDSSGVAYAELPIDGHLAQSLSLTINATDAKAIDRVYLMVNRPRSKNSANNTRGSFQWNAVSASSTVYGTFQMTSGNSFGQQYVDLMENGNDSSIARINPLTHNLEIKFKWVPLSNYGYTGQNVISYYIREKNGASTGWHELSDSENIFVVPGYPRLAVSVDANSNTPFTTKGAHFSEQNVEVVKFRLSATGAEDVNVRSLRSTIFAIPATDDLSANFNTLRNFKLIYNGKQIGVTQNFLTPESLQSPTCQLCINAVNFNLNDGDLIVTKGSSVVVSIVADVASEADGGVSGAQFQGATGFIGRFNGPAISAIGDTTGLSLIGFDHLGKKLVTESQPMTSRYSITVN